MKKLLLNLNYYIFSLPTRNIVIFIIVCLSFNTVSFFIKNDLISFILLACSMAPIVFLNFVTLIVSGFKIDFYGERWLRFKNDRFIYFLNQHWFLIYRPIESYDPHIKSFLLSYPTTPQFVSTHKDCFSMSNKVYRFAKQNEIEEYGLNKILARAFLHFEDKDEVSFMW